MARVYSLVLEGPKGESNAVTNTIPIFGFKASVLFDLGATNSFVSSTFEKLSRLALRPLEVGLVVATLVGKTVVCKREVCE